jgi:uncharacterized membrane protein
MKQLTGYFIRGLIYLAPLGLTVYIAYAAIKFLDNLLPFDTPGVSLVIVIMLITMLGFIGSFLISSPVIRFFEKILEKTPLVNIVYTSIKDLVNAFTGEKSKFTKPVLVKFDKNIEAYKPGFVTDESLEKFGNSNLVAVYMPHSYNFSGNVFLVPKENVKRLDVSSVEFMKYIVSAGVSGNL